MLVINLLVNVNSHIVLMDNNIVSNPYRKEGNGGKEH